MIFSSHHLKASSVYVFMWKKSRIKIDTMSIFELFMTRIKSYCPAMGQSQQVS